MSIGAFHLHRKDKDAVKIKHPTTESNIAPIRQPYCLELIRNIDSITTKYRAPLKLSSNYNQIQHEAAL